jgi:hypothetical protein
VAVELHVDGVVKLGQFGEFLKAAERWREFRRHRGWCVPRLLAGLSGTMNLVRFIFRYDSLAGYEREEQLVAQDPEYVGLAMLMPFDGRLEFTIFREHEPPTAG